MLLFVCDRLRKLCTRYRPRDSMIACRPCVIIVLRGTLARTPPNICDLASVLPVTRTSHYVGKAQSFNRGLQYPPLHGPVHTPDNKEQVGHPTCIIEGLACWLTLCILEKIICNSTNSVQISFIQTLKLIVFFMKNMMVLMAKCFDD